MGYTANISNDANLHDARLRLLGADRSQEPRADCGIRAHGVSNAGSAGAWAPQQRRAHLMALAMPGMPTGAVHQSLACPTWKYPSSREPGYGDELSVRNERLQRGSRAASGGMSDVQGGERHRNRVKPRDIFGWTREETVAIVADDVKSSLIAVVQMRILNPRRRRLRARHAQQADHCLNSIGHASKAMNREPSHKND
ncbi:hypothetical protein B0H17DRAFT_1134093 [Mycena rosella]|uniref:Uncharacterized protein n=1 Tax=Mycena rosella TaxID=1033263 RepID=A0AAD7GJG3_MYCRO|nr:hypothetical protein B0H17DRAFT_1134093 [Mycena rosella]